MIKPAAALHRVLKRNGAILSLVARCSYAPVQQLNTLWFSDAAVARACIMRPRLVEAPCIPRNSGSSSRRARNLTRCGP